MNVYINLTFVTSEGKRYTMRIPKAVSSPGVSLIKNSMNGLITANCVKTNKGDLIARDSAQVVRVTTIDFDLTSI